MANQVHVGDAVRVPMGHGKAAGVVTEDRGPIGLGGRHLYQVEVAMDPFDSVTVELPEDEFEVNSETNGPKPLVREEIIDYLKTGGLIAILRLNLGDGIRQPKVWICRDSLGGVTHTLSEERGLIGGETVPLSTVHQGRVFKPKENQVLDFLMKSFRLHEGDAREVLNSVGVAP
jgi:hypothetical protein